MDNAIQIALLQKGMADLSAQLQSMAIDVKKFLEARYITEERLDMELNTLEKKNKEYITQSLEPLSNDLKALKSGVWFILGSVLLTLIAAVLKLVLKI